QGPRRTWGPLRGGSGASRGGRGQEAGNKIARWPMAIGLEDSRERSICPLGRIDKPPPDLSCRRLFANGLARLPDTAGGPPAYARGSMRTLSWPRGLAGMLVLAALATPAPAARSSHAGKPAAPVPCEPLPGPAPDASPRALDTVGLNFPSRTLELADTTVQVCALARAAGVVGVCALVASLGGVRGARVVRGGTPLDSAVVDAVRWWLFEPARRDRRPVPARVAVGVAVRPPRDADPLVPDVLGMA